MHAPDDPLRRGVDFDIDSILMVRDQFHELSEVIVDALRSPDGYKGVRIVIQAVTFGEQLTDTRSSAVIRSSDSAIVID